MAVALLLTGLLAASGLARTGPPTQGGRPASTHVSVVTAAPAGGPTDAAAHPGANVLRALAERFPLPAVALVGLVLVLGSRRSPDGFPPGRPAAAAHRRLWRPRRAPPMTA